MKEGCHTRIINCYLTENRCNDYLRMTARINNIANQKGYQTKFLTGSK